MAAAILGLVASFIGPAMELGKCIAEPIKRQFNYLCFFNSNVQSLRDEAKKLDDARAGLQMRVTTAKTNLQEIFPQVESWLNDADEIQEKMSGMESEMTNIQGGCLTVKSRFSLSKRAKKTTEAMKQLLEVCPKPNEPISNPRPPASMLPIPLGPTYKFESRKHTEEEIMLTLRDEKVNMLGICGMGGVGKTTMAKEIVERAKKEHLFDDIVMVVVSQQVDKSRIQGEMARLLGLELKEENLSSRARELQARLMIGRRALLVLDDVWKYLDFEELIGIPPQRRRSVLKFQLTSSLNSRS